MKPWILLSSCLVVTACGGGGGSGGGTTLQALNDSYTVRRAQTIDLDLLANDTYSDRANVTINLPPSNDYTLVDGKIRFTAPDADSFNITFTYSISEDGQESENATVTIVAEAVPQPGLIDANSDTAVTTISQPVEIDVLANDTVPNGELSLTEIFRDARNGTAQIIDGKVLYTPNADFYGTDYFSYSVEDNTGNGYGGVNVSVLVQARTEGRYHSLKVGDVKDFSLEDTGFTISRETSDEGYANTAGVGDLNADGYQDAIICYPDESSAPELTELEKAGECELKLGADRDSSLRSFHRLWGTQASMQLGISANAAGDVNNDGYDDFLIQAGEGNQQRWFLIFGAENLPTNLLVGSEANAVTLELSTSQLILALSGIGDVNNDGYADFSLVKRVDLADDTQQTRLQIVFGSEAIQASNTPLDLDAFTRPEQSISYVEAETLPTGDHFRFGSFLHPMGDIDQDGYDDFSINAAQTAGPNSNEDGLIILFGKQDYSAEPTSISTLNSVYLTAGTVPVEPRLISGGAGDFNGDGKNEVLVQDQEQVYAIDLSLDKQGRLSILDPNRQITIISSFFRYAYPRNLGDINGDGIDDISINNVAKSQKPLLLIYGRPDLSPEISVDDLGNPELTDGTVGAVIHNYATSPNHDFKIWSSPVGDMDGDGYADLLIGGYANGDYDTDAEYTLLFGARHWGR
ncbi:hypothetical protein DU002_10255 [Corallincola holothuriorum]|uniref:Uncharacterized protein n=1 Tax=Corallincola holothuriorum TaxID=2282215 RepID=A0A368NHR2_9GAMM|nr:Ig-like domain-containing protein [Corallincola holothuriorum]RCU49998.1 hypothetical protein DU002_10255 [Corallincola holothuriorum]